MPLKRDEMRWLTFYFPKIEKKCWFKLLKAESIIILYTYWIQIIIFWKCSILFPSEGSSAIRRRSSEGLLRCSKTTIIEKTLATAGLEFLWNSSSAWAKSTSTALLYRGLKTNYFFLSNSAFPPSAVQAAQCWS